MAFEMILKIINFEHSTLRTKLKVSKETKFWYRYREPLRKWEEVSQNRQFRLNLPKSIKTNFIYQFFFTYRHNLSSASSTTSEHSVQTAHSHHSCHHYSCWIQLFSLSSSWTSTSKTSINENQLLRQQQRNSNHSKSCVK